MEASDVAVAITLELISYHKLCVRAFFENYGIPIESIMGLVCESIRELLFYLGLMQTDLFDSFSRHQL